MMAARVLNELAAGVLSITIAEATGRRAVLGLDRWHPQGIR
jgi:hypothetical protein